MLQLQKLKVCNTRRKGTRREVAGIWDPGSTLSFITFALANDLDLHGDPVELEICTVGGVETKFKSEKFQLILFDKDGREIQVEVLGIDRISTDIESVNIEGIRGLFQMSGAANVDRPDAGPVDLLMGFSYAQGCHYYFITKFMAISWFFHVFFRFFMVLFGQNSWFIAFSPYFHGFQKIKFMVFSWFKNKIHGFFMV